MADHERRDAERGSRRRAHIEVRLTIARVPWRHPNADRLEWSSREVHERRDVEMVWPTPHVTRAASLRAPRVEKRMRVAIPSGQLVERRVVLHNESSTRVGRAVRTR